MNNIGFIIRFPKLSGSCFPEFKDILEDKEISSLASEDLSKAHSLNVVERRKLIRRKRICILQKEST